MKSTDWYSIDLFIKISVVTFVLSKKKKHIHFSNILYRKQNKKANNLPRHIFS